MAATARQVKTRSKPTCTRIARYEHIRDEHGLLSMTITTGNKVEKFSYFTTDYGTDADEINGKAILRRVFRLVKTVTEDGEPSSYDVAIDHQPADPKKPVHTCECKGFLRWNHCKHTDALSALIKANKI